MSSVTVKYSITYSSAPAAVFAAITDVAREPEWQTEILSVWQDPSGPVTIGTRIGHERKVMGKVTEQISEVVILEPNARYEMRQGAGNEEPPFRVAYQLAPAGDGSTLLDFTLAIEGVPAMFASAVRRKLSAQVTAQFDRLGELLAAGWAAASS